MREAIVFRSFRTLFADCDMTAVTYQIFLRDIPLVTPHKDS